MVTTARDKEVLIAPSLLSADFSCLMPQVVQTNPEADWLHLDIMDAHFVPNLTFGPPLVASLSKAIQRELPDRFPMELDCHLMVSNPEVIIPALAKSGATRASIHLEIGDTENRLASLVKEGLKPGLAVNPDGALSSYERYLEKVDVILLMTVFPGFAGQAFIEDVLPKIEATREAIDRAGLATLIEVDGGIDPETAPRAAEAGAHVFVAGSAIFGRPDPRAAAAELRQAASRAVRQ
jgi:ribulose-phosphate 3-epimerase